MGDEVGHHCQCHVVGVILVVEIKVQFVDHMRRGLWFRNLHEVDQPSFLHSVGVVDSRGQLGDNVIDGVHFYNVVWFGFH